MKAYRDLTIVFSAWMAVLLMGCTSATPQLTLEEEPLPPTGQPATEASSQETEQPVTEEPAQARQPEGPWKLSLQRDIAQPVRMAAFYNETFGITVGATGAGKTHYSTDSGETWTRSEDSGGCLYGLEIIDEQTVWVCGRMVGASFSTPGGVRLSLDGGQNWEDQANFATKPGFCPLSFVDTQTGWFVSGNKLHSTLDGGATVEAISLPRDKIRIIAISLLSAEGGYVLDDDGNLYITQDGGITWETGSLGMDRFGAVKVLRQNDLGSAAMRFIDQDKGVVAMNLTDSTERFMMVLRTADRGQTWEAEAVLDTTGVPYITRDGSYLTVYNLLDSTISVFKNTGS